MACVAAIGGVLWYVKRKTSRGKVSGTELGIHVIARQGLSPKATVCIVQIGHRHVVLGITDQSVNYICDLGEETPAAGAPAQHSNPAVLNPQVLEQARRMQQQTPQYTAPIDEPAYGHDPDAELPDLSLGGYMRSIFSRRVK